MPEWLLVLLGFVGGCGLLALVGCGLMLPVSGPGLYTVICVRDGAEELERQLRSLVWLQGWSLLCCPVVVADMGLNEQGRALVDKLVRRWPQLIVCDEAQLIPYITEETR